MEGMAHKWSDGLLNARNWEQLFGEIYIKNSNEQSFRRLAIVFGVFTQWPDNSDNSGDDIMIYQLFFLFLALSGRLFRTNGRKV